MRHWRSLMIGLGLLLALGVANRAILGHERTLADGRVLLLELAPVDPRSMMQGDYMALRFAAAREIDAAVDPNCANAAAREAQETTATNPARDRPDCILTQTGWARTHLADGYAVFALDEHGVGRLLRIQDAPTPVKPGQVAVRFRRRGWEGIRIASNAWFFAEGQAERFEPAHYGELRVAANGTALLTGLRDAQRKRL